MKLIVKSRDHSIEFDDMKNDPVYNFVSDTDRDKRLLVLVEKMADCIIKMELKGDKNEDVK
jgi:recombinational DNA repair protein RecR